MMFKNKGDASHNIPKSLTYIGGRYNAATYKDVTYYYIETHMSNYKAAIDLLYQITCRLNFNEDDLRTERKVVIEELGQTLDSFDHKFFSLANGSLLHEDNVYMNSVIGTKKTLGNLTLGNLKAYAKERYNNHVIMLNCDESIKDAAFKYVKHVFGHQETISINEERYMDLGKRFDPKIIFLNKNFKQYISRITFRTYPVSHIKENITLKFIHYCLTASGLHSILNHTIREKRGLVYSMQSYIELFRYLGLYCIQFSSNSKRTDYILNLVFNVLHNLKTKGLSENIIEFYRTSYLNTIKMRLADEEYRTNSHGLMSFYGADVADADILKYVRAITNQDIVDVASYVFDFTMMGVISVGNYSSVNVMSKNVEDIINTYMKAL
jgi:predicted Zn-dependent peptidase